MTPPAGLPWWLWVLLNVGAVYRLTRLLTHDAFPPIARVRDAVITRYDGRWQAYLATCEWCCSVYVAVFAVAVMLWLPYVWAVLAAVAALSAAAGWLAGRE